MAWEEEINDCDVKERCYVTRTTQTHWLPRLMRPETHIHTRRQLPSCIRGMKPEGCSIITGARHRQWSSCPDFSLSEQLLRCCQWSNLSTVTCFIGLGQRSGVGWLHAAGAPVTWQSFKVLFKTISTAGMSNGAIRKLFSHWKSVKRGQTCWDVRVWLFLWGVFFVFTRNPGWKKISCQWFMYHTN